MCCRESGAEIVELGIGVWCGTGGGAGGGAGSGGGLAAFVWEGGSGWPGGVLGFGLDFTLGCRYRGLGVY